MLNRGPIAITARIKIGQHPDTWLGYFHNMREAVDLLCPPASYRVRVVQPNGEAHERVRRQLGGLILNTDQANILLDTHTITYKRNHQDVTVTLVRLSSTGLYVPVKPVMHPPIRAVSDLSSNLAATALSRKESA